jgi:hypothetical protein
MVEIGLRVPDSWVSTIGFAVAGLVMLLAYSPVADRIATRLVAKPPTLGAFRGLQQSKAKLIAGIIVAWILGGFIEEVVLRGIVLRWTEAQLASWLIGPVATAIAIGAAAAIAWLIHLYQGLRAAIIVTQLSVLFGVLFVVSGHDLWAVVLCHGLYDTIAFVRFATGKSKYARLDGGP